jgi:hypothetical protein
MDRKSKEQDVKERAESYQRGLIALTNALNAFRKLSGIDLRGDIDVSGRHMGQAPYVKLTAERLTEITASLDAEYWHADVVISEIADALAGDADVISIDRKTSDCRIEAPARRLVIEPYRPGLVKR